MTTMPIIHAAATAALLSLLCLPAGGAPLFFGEYAPLTNSRYGGRPGRPALVGTGAETVLVWTTETGVRATRLADGEKRVGHFVMPSAGRTAAVWNGQRVLVVAPSDQNGALNGRLLDAAGTPVSAIFKVPVEPGGFVPRLASNGQRVLLLHERANQLRAFVLSADGRTLLSSTLLSTDVISHDVTSNGSGFVAVAVTNNRGVRAWSFDANGSSFSETTLGSLQSPYTSNLTVASDGNSYLAVWSDASSVYSAAVSSAGTGSPATVIDNTQITASAFAAVWSGNHYEVAYRANAEAAEIRLLNVTPGSPSASRTATFPSTPISEPALAFAAGRTRVAWNDREEGLIWFRDTSGTGSAEVGSVGASDQTLMAAATSASATMFVWTELLDDVSRTHLGFRDRQGSWIERVLGTSLERNAIAASNGSDWMVVIGDSKDWLAYRISSTGTLQGQPSRIATRANVRSFDDITWNGRKYVLAGVDTSGRVIAATLSTSGLMSPTLVIRQPRETITLEKPSVASDGTNTLIAWSEIQGTPCFPVCDWAIDGINAALLGPELQLVGESAFMVVDNDALAPQVVWSTEYMVFWGHSAVYTNEGNLRAQRIGRDGKRVGGAFPIAGTKPSYDVQALGLRIGAAVTWVEADGVAGARRVAVVRPDGTITHEATSPEPELKPTVLALLPDERIALAASIPQTEPPHHGATRIQLAIADVIPPVALPGPPLLTVRPTTTTAELDWIPPQGPVNGYRLEYRVGDGAWNELDRFHGPVQTTASIRLSGNRNVAFRVRAFNDAGAGNYSAIRSVGTGKRRSVR